MGNEQSHNPGPALQMDQMDLGGSEDFDCPVCLQVLERPVRTQCGHVFTVNGRKCPLCRGLISHTEPVATDIEQQMMFKKVKCQGCNTEVFLIDMRAHTRICSKYQEDFGCLTHTLPLPPARCALPSYVQPIRSTEPRPNSETYTCPYCQQRNYDDFGLAEHCITSHYFDHRRVVCPICASMPWGDPSYHSRNFIGHLMLRHQFSYDYFVDYHQDEEGMLQNAILNSYQDIFRIQDQ
ncbi:E3 ubiquitin-protein ligase RNF114 [Pristis pectinata]|uniref:E3 ubiquitin-protein ligase RNF114 n=1 Tax=Pristis pectinata TaxID=685728 RepID=UPI00223DFDCF|nr:E3 ubiquitin-protein ligase RNF114 [Pristis pectinata]